MDTVENNRIIDSGPEDGVGIDVQGSSETRFRVLVLTQSPLGFSGITQTEHRHILVASETQRELILVDGSAILILLKQEACHVVVTIGVSETQRTRRRVVL